MLFFIDVFITISLNVFESFQLLFPATCSQELFTSKLVCLSKNFFQVFMYRFDELI